MVALADLNRREMIALLGARAPSEADILRARWEAAEARRKEAYDIYRGLAIKSARAFKRLVAAADRLPPEVVEILEGGQ